MNMTVIGTRYRSFSPIKTLIEACAASSDVALWTMALPVCFQGRVLDARAFVRNSLRVPRPKQIGPAWDRHTFVEQEGRMRPAEVAELRAVLASRSLTASPARPRRRQTSRGRRSLA